MAGGWNLREARMPAERFDFPNAQGQNLAALLDRPAGEPRAYALFAHCFTCGKDVHAARRISEGLTALGIAVPRFDFTGLGSSEGEFANTTFSSNVADLIAAAAAMRRAARAPAILVGHSLGGAAVLAAAADVPEARAVVTIAAPCDPSHVTGLFKDRLDEIGAKGEVEVALAGRPFRISRAFVSDVAEQNYGAHRQSTQGIVIFHSPGDDRRHRQCQPHLCRQAPRASFADSADHLLSGAATPTSPMSSAPGPSAIRDAVPCPLAGWAQNSRRRETRQGRFQQEVTLCRTGSWPTAGDVGGLDSGRVRSLVLAGLGACTAMTPALAERRCRSNG